MNFWQILGIEPTGDKSAIKRAYAKLLKVHHPEDDPQGYQKLREAFDRAMKAAIEEEQKKGKEHHYEYKDEIEDEIKDEIEIDGVAAGGDINEEIRYRSTYRWIDVAPHQALNEVQLFFRQMRELYCDFTRRIDPQEWNALMADDFLWKVEYQEERLNVLMLFLEKHQNLPHEVWKILDRSFHLVEDKEYLLEIYDEPWIEFLIRQIYGTTALDYECFANRELHFDIEHYLTLRQQAQAMLMEDRTEAAADVLAEAHQLFQDDPDLQLMRAKYLRKVGNKEEALASLDNLLALKPKDYEAHLLRAQIYYEEQMYDEAIRECELLREYHGLDKDIWSVSLASKLELGRLEEIWRENAETQVNSTGYVHFLFDASLGQSLWNKHLFSQKYNPYYKLSKKNAIKFFSFTCGVIFLRLSWLYLIVFWAVQLLFHPPGFMILLYFILGVSAWKTLRTLKLFCT